MTHKLTRRQVLKLAVLGDERLVWLAYVLLNAGVLSAALGQWLRAPAIIPLLGRAAEVLAAAAFALHAWPRIKPHGK